MELGRVPRESSSAWVLAARLSSRKSKLDVYEVLVTASEDVKWVSGSKGALNPAVLEGRLVEGGYEANGEPLYVAQAYHDHAWRPGKHSASLPCEYFGHCNAQ